MLEQVSELARRAGQAIMQIKQGLASIAPDIPQLSEEDPPAWEERRHWQRYWLIDPLDGTKEFINKNGEFTVNIALIEQGVPVLGVVYAPVQNILYSAANKQAWKETCGQRLPIKFCLVAEGKAQLYPRFGPTHTWDTAAGHAIAIAAGAHVTDWKGVTLDYSPRESLINPGFRVSIF